MLQKSKSILYISLGCRVRSHFVIHAWIYHCSKPKSWLRFGDLDLIYKVTGGLRLLQFLKIIFCMLSHEHVDGFSQNLHG